MTDYWQHPDWPNWLSAIRAAPDDDVTRLACADYLDENGYEGRATVIRTEVNNIRLDREVLCHQPGAEMGDWCNDTLCPKCGREIRLLPTTPVDYGDSLRDLTDHLHGFDWDRGFLARVSAPLATLYGGECRGCDGRGGWGDVSDGDGGAVVCSDCNGTGTGRTVGILSDLLRREPVLRVEVTNVEPWTSELESASDDLPFSWWRDSEWVNRRGNERNAIGNLPDSLFVVMGDMFPGARLNWGFAANEHLAFPTREAATDALSAALLSWGLGQIREGVTR